MESGRGPRGTGIAVDDVTRGHASAWTREDATYWDNDVSARIQRIMVCSEVHLCLPGSLGNPDVAQTIPLLTYRPP
jgi:hypothetical protein